nr:SIR2 family protein [uncultured Pedobacter sp.]
MSINSFTAKFKSHLNKFHTSPFLFIGSGLSRRYLKLPTWYQLLDDFSETLGLEYEFGYYVSKVENNLPKLATVLAEEFHKIWWTSETFRENREKFKDIASINTYQPFKIELSLFIQNNGKLDADLEQEIDLLKQAVIDGIITTNWDTFLSEILPDFEVFIGQKQLMFSDHASIGEIFKIHGCVTKPESIIVTEEDYEHYHKKNEYLAAKLFTIFAEHPVVFLGYSISDNNIIEILSSIVNCVDKGDLDKLRDRLILVEWSPDSEIPTIEDSHIVINHLPLPIKLIKAKNFNSVYEVLANLKQRLPIKILRKCKNAVYELVKTNQSVNTILVGDIDNVKDDKEIEFVIGVGVASQYSENGYIGISNNDIFRDIVFDESKWDSKKVITDVIPKLFKGNIYLPLYKYLRENGDLDDRGKLFQSDQYNDKVTDAISNNSMKVYYPKGPTYIRKKDMISSTITSLDELLSKYEFRHVLLYISFMQHKYIDLEKLKQFLLDHYSDDLIKSTDFKKIICYYDYLKYGLQIDLLVEPEAA